MQQTDELALVVTQQPAITLERIQAVKDVIAKKCTNAELEVFVEACRRTGLDPFAKQIYAIKRGDSLTIQIGIDGFRAIAERSGKYLGQLGPFWCGKDGVWRDAWLDIEAPVAAKVGIIREGFRETIWGVARTAAYRQSSNSLWATMPDVMIAKCAESLALRKTFPIELGGLYSREEMMQAEIEGNVVDGEIVDSEPTTPAQTHSSNQPATTQRQAAASKKSAASPTLRQRSAAVGIPEEDYPAFTRAVAGHHDIVAADRSLIEREIALRERAWRLGWHREQYEQQRASLLEEDQSYSNENHVIVESWLAEQEGQAAQAQAAIS